MALSVRNTLVLAKVEAVEGTPETLTEADDAILVNNVVPTPNADIVESQEFRGTLDAGEPIIGGTPMTIDIQTYLKGSGSPGVVGEQDPLYQGCGLDPTIVATTSVTYNLISTGIPSLTIYVFRDGYRWVFSGCRGNMQLGTVTRQLGTLDFSFQGRYVSKTDVAATTPTFDAVRPPVWRGGTFAIDSVAAALQQFTLNLNNTIALPDNPNDPEGFDAPIISARDIQGTMNPLSTLMATRNIFQDFRDGTTRPLQAIIGSVAGNTCKIDVPKAKYRGTTETDRDSLLADETPFSAVSTDDGFSIAFT